MIYIWATIYGAAIGGGIAAIGDWVNVDFILMVSIPILAALIAAFMSWKWHVLSWRSTIWIAAILITCVFIYIHVPISYEDDNLEQFRFSSDDRSDYYGVTYDKCQLISIGNATDDSVLLWFGCTSPQLQTIKEDLPEHIYMFYGNCGKVTAFDRTLINNEFPDYVIEFPFHLDGIGRICQKRIYIENNQPVGSEDVALISLPAGHLDEKENTLAVEWADAPRFNEFSFYGYNLFKRISYDKLAIYWDIDDEWKRERDFSENMPESFAIELIIPNDYEIERLEEYNISHKTSGRYENVLVVSTDLIEEKIFHLVLVDSTKQRVKWLFESLFAILVLFLILDALRTIMKKEERRRP